MSAFGWSLRDVVQASMLGRWGSIGTCAAGFGAALLVAFACVPDPRLAAFRCQPSGPSPQCPEIEGERYMCCSDDPAALDLANLDGPTLPAYQGRDGGTGVPLFSAARNASSDWGTCVQRGAVPPAGALEEAVAEGCPVPCNPNWSSEELDVVCGPNTICCQTVELDESDCLLDPTLGENGCWRPAQGGDIEGLGGLEATTWSSSEHLTLQDPGGHACEAFVGGLTDPLLEQFAVERDAVMRACLRRLGVANQRGFCMGGAGVNFCPLAQPSYRDACEQLNDAEGRVGCD
jgi:hypothetical protein